MFVDPEVPRGILAYYELSVAHIEAISAINSESYASVPAFQRVLPTLTTEKLVQQNLANLEHIAAGARSGDWSAYLESLAVRGRAFARGGMTYSSWATVFQRMLSRVLDLIFQQVRDREELRVIVKGTTALFDVIVDGVGQAFFDEQQAMLREVSTPILRADERMLLVPLVGALDDERMRLLFHKLLAAIRAERARAVVVDLTGVPTVDSSSMGHLDRLASSASLMGARVLLSGLAPDVCRTLIGLGVDMPGAETVATLEEALRTARTARASARPAR